MFLQSGSQNGSIWSLLCELKTNWLCEPENNLRTRYIQNRPDEAFYEDAFQHRKACRLEEHRLDISQCLDICIKKDSIAVKRLKSCCGGQSEQNCKPFPLFVTLTWSALAGEWASAP